MKKTFLFIIFISLSIFVISCDSSEDTPLTPKVTTGSLTIDSQPQGAEIWLDGVNTDKVTPATIENVEEGQHNVVLKLSNYEDHSFQANVVANEEFIETQNVLTPIYISFSTPVRIWETTGTSSNQPSGLDLSSGTAFGTSDAENRDSIDIYYYSSNDGSTFLVQSSHLNANMNRETFFKVGTGTNLEDGEDSSVKDNNWKNSMSDREEKYVFLYDADGHYSKLKIISYGGGTVGEPSWVEVAWIYNTAKNSVVF